MNEPHLPELSSVFCEGNFLMIDGDSVPYAIGWMNKDHQDVELVKKMVASWLEELVLLSNARTYIGVLASPHSLCFRYSVYKYRPYKGQRKEADDWLKFWKPIIVGILIQEHGFVMAPAHLETDDVIAALGLQFSKSSGPYAGYICSPDKDLKQIPGYHMDYSKMLDDHNLKTELVSHETAKYNWAKQMLMGDSSDNIAGIPGMGEKKAAAKLEGVHAFHLRTTVANEYEAAFGPHYGPIICEETALAVTMMTLNSPAWHKYGFQLDEYLQHIRQV